MSTLINSETKSQNDLILAYLQSGKRITPIEALELFKCFRLTSRICDLKGRGIAIQKQFVKVNSGKKVMQYWIDIE